MKNAFKKAGILGYSFLLTIFFILRVSPSNIPDNPPQAVKHLEIKDLRMVSAGALALALLLFDSSEMNQNIKKQLSPIPFIKTFLKEYSRSFLLTFIHETSHALSARYLIKAFDIKISLGGSSFKASHALSKNISLGGLNPTTGITSFTHYKDKSKKNDPLCGLVNLAGILGALSTNLIIKIIMGEDLTIDHHDWKQIQSLLPFISAEYKVLSDGGQFLKNSFGIDTATSRYSQIIQEAIASLLFILEYITICKKVSNSSSLLEEHLLMLYVHLFNLSWYGYFHIDI